MDIHPENPEQLRFVLAPYSTLASSTLVQVSSAPVMWLLLFQILLF